MNRDKITMRNKKGKQPPDPINHPNHLRKRRYSAIDSSNVNEDTKVRSLVTCVTNRRYSYTADIYSSDINLQIQLNSALKESTSCNVTVCSNAEFNLEYFSDEVLFEIFKCLNTYDLLSIRDTCKRFNNLLSDKRFWNHISLLNADENTYQQILSVLKLANSTTKTLELQEPKQCFSNFEMPKIFSKALSCSLVNRCNHLKILELYSIKMDMSLLKFTHFPKTLKRLVIYNCSILNFTRQESSGLFWRIHTQLLNLEELLLEYNSWFDSYDIMPISKLTTLRTLSLRGCLNFFNIVVYASMATVHGFAALEYLDLRHIPLTDSDLQCFNVVETLKEVMLESPPFLSDSKEDVLQTERAISNRTAHKTALSACNEMNPNVANNSNASSISDLTSMDNRRKRTAFWNSLTRNSIKWRQLRNPDHVIFVDLRNLQNTLMSNQNGIVTQRITPMPLSVVSAAPVQRDLAQIAEPLVSVLGDVNPVIRHGLFHNLINSLQNNDNGEADESTDDSDNGDFRCIYKDLNYTRNFISDQGLCSFGRSLNANNQGRIWISVRRRPNETHIERLTVRNYTKVTDLFLNHIVQCSPRLTYLDVTGTSVTVDGLKRFKSLKPECKVIAAHLTHKFE